MLALKNRNQIILDYAPLVRVIARKIAIRLPSSVDIDDLVSSGFVGLIDAVEKFDASKDVQFKTYSEWRIKGAILDELRKLDVISRCSRDKIKLHEKTVQKLEQDLQRASEEHERAQAMNMSLKNYKIFCEENIASFSVSLTTDFIELKSEDEDIDSKIFQAELTDEIHLAIEELPVQYADVINMYFFQEKTLKECSNVLDISESRVSQIRKNALKKIRKKFPLLAYKF